MPRTTSSAGANQYVGTQLRRRREAMQISQAELASRLEVSGAYVQKVEAGGANMTVGQLTRFAEALDSFVVLEIAPLPQSDLDFLTPAL